MKPRARYQNGCITREARMHDSDVWVLRWREMNPDGSWIRRKSAIGTAKEHPNKAAAFKASEFLRSTINRETRPPRVMAELVDHYRKNELPNKTPYTQEVYTGYITQWITPKWGTSIVYQRQPATRSEADLTAVTLQSLNATYRVLSCT